MTRHPKRAPLLVAAIAAIIEGCAGAPEKDGGAPSGLEGPVRVRKEPRTRQPAEATPPPSLPSSPSSPGTAAGGSTAPAPQKGAGKKPAGRATGSDARERILRLQSPKTAGEAFREIWEAPRSLIPQLILEVGNDEPSSLRELTVLVIDARRFAAVAEKDGTLYYDIPGMARVKYDDLVVGKTPKGLKVILRRLRAPFTVGEVLRAGLINRFRSTDYPAGDDGADPVGWWQRFHERVRGSL